MHNNYQFSYCYSSPTHGNHWRISAGFPRPFELAGIIYGHDFLGGIACIQVPIPGGSWALAGDHRNRINLAI